MPVLCRHDCLRYHSGCGIPPEGCNRLRDGIIEFLLIDDRPGRFDPDKDIAPVLAQGGRAGGGAHEITRTADTGGLVTRPTVSRAFSTTDMSMPMREQSPVISRTAR